MIRHHWGNRLALVVALALGASAVTAGCSGPYSAKAEKPKRPEKKKRPPEPPPVVAEVKYVDECKTKFNEEAKGVRRRSPQSLIDQGDTAMQTADASTDPAGRASLVVEAINKYKNALGQDPYSATATYRLAVAYARVNYKGCTLALLKRLTELQKHPDFEAEATRMIKSVDGEPAFKGFSKDANTAAGN